jgi:hypothetical protein
VERKKGLTRTEPGKALFSKLRPGDIGGRNAMKLAEDSARKRDVKRLA